MIRNILDGSIVAEDIVLIDAAITTLETKLTILMSLSPEERKSLPGMGPQSESFAGQALQAAQLNEDLMPRGLDLESIERDKVLREQLLPRFERLRHLTERMDHTIHLAGSEYYRGALAIYKALKAFGRSAGLEALIEELRRRFPQRRKPTETPTEEPSI